MTERIDTKAVLARMQSIYGCDCIPGKTPGLLNQFRELCAALAQEITDSETKQSRIEALEQERDADWRNFVRLRNDNERIRVLGEELTKKDARIEELEEALRMLTFSPDGLPDTWPSKETVDTALTAKEKP